MRENSNSNDGRTYQWTLPEKTDMECVQEVSRADTGYFRQIVFEGTTADCTEETQRDATGGTDKETLGWRVYPDTEPPVLGTFFDMDLSEIREVEINKNAYLTVRVNEAATQHGYAW